MINYNITNIVDWKDPREIKSDYKLQDVIIKFNNLRFQLTDYSLSAVQKEDIRNSITNILDELYKCIFIECNHIINDTYKKYMFSIASSSVFEAIRLETTQRLVSFIQNNRQYINPLGFKSFLEQTLRSADITFINTLKNDYICLDLKTNEPRINIYYMYKIICVELGIKHLEHINNE